MDKNYSERLNNVIPGGAHTYSRGDDQFPVNAPKILTKGKGAYVWDPFGNKYLDYGMGLRSVNIGYGNKEVAKAAYSEILKGNNLTRASTTELNAAELFTKLIPSSKMVKFAKHGSTVTTAAIKLARAHTERKYIAVPYEHPFFSFDDWFIGSTIIKKGTLSETSSYTLKFNYNDINSLKVLFEKYPKQISAVILEPVTSNSPCLKCNLNENCNSCHKNQFNFLHQVRYLTKREGALMILDEMITGFRWHLKGAQTFFNINPDLCTFGKAMANGFAVSALGGNAEIMNIGGILDEGKERVFLTSTTHGAEMSSLGAFMKTVEILEREEVIKHCWDYGNKLINACNNISYDIGIDDFFYLEGYPCSPNFVTKDQELSPSLNFRTLFVEKMLESKILMPYISISFSHKQKELNFTLKGFKKSLILYKRALDNGIKDYLISKPIKPVFRKYN